VLFVTELLQSLGNGHANARQPRRNRSRQRKIDLPSHTASAWQAIGDSGDTDCHARGPSRTGICVRYPAVSRDVIDPFCLRLTQTPLHYSDVDLIRILFVFLREKC
jgi:hypothetical protein